MSLTSADIVAAEAALRDEIVRNLMLGNSVHLPGIGHFSLSVDGDIYEEPSYTPPSATQCQSKNGEIPPR